MKVVFKLNSVEKEIAQTKVKTTELWYKLRLKLSNENYKRHWFPRMCGNVTFALDSGAGITWQDLTLSEDGETLTYEGTRTGLVDGHAHCLSTIETIFEGTPLDSSIITYQTSQPWLKWNETERDGIARGAAPFERLLEIAWLHYNEGIHTMTSDTAIWRLRKMLEEEDLSEENRGKIEKSLRWEGAPPKEEKPEEEEGSDEYIPL